MYKTTAKQQFNSLNLKGYSLLLGLKLYQPHLLADYNEFGTEGYQNLALLPISGTYCETFVFPIFSPLRTFHVKHTV